MPLTASSIYGTFAANPVTDASGVVYLQDLASNVFAVDLRTGRRKWMRRYDSQDIGPNGRRGVRRHRLWGHGAVRVRPRRPDGARAVAKHPACPARAQKGGGELASGFGIDIQPQVANGRVYLSTGALLGGGIAYALDAGPVGRSGRLTP